MGFKINTNIDALTAYYALMKVNAATTKSQIRLATGKQINHVWDDTSGFTIGKQLETKAKILKSVQGNISSGKDMLATAESALLNIKELVTKIKVKISDSSNPTADRQALARDIAALGEEIASIFKTTKFNESPLLVGTLAAADEANHPTFSFQVTDKVEDRMILDFAYGIASSGSANITYSDGLTSESLFLEDEITNILSSIMAVARGYIQDAEYATSIGSLRDAAIGASLSLTSSNGSDISQVDFLQEKVDDALQKIGYYAQRFDIKNDFLDVAIQNAESSVSRLFDTDYALEQLNATKNNMMQQAAMSMMAQLSFAPQQVLQLFQ